MKIQLQFGENPSVSNIIYSSVVASSDHSYRELQMATDETHQIQLDEFGTENDLPAFLFLMLDKLENMFWLSGNGYKSYPSSVCSCG